MPLVETVSRLSLNTRTIKINLGKVLCAGMIPVEIEGRANIKLAGREEEGMENAIERFLGKSEDNIDKTAQQVIEGNLRGILASYSPEEANVKRIEVMRGPSLWLSQVHARTHRSVCTHGRSPAVHGPRADDQPLGGGARIRDPQWRGLRHQVHPRGDQG